MIMLDDLEEVKRRVTELQRATDEARGAYASLKRQLASKFGCESVKEAEELLTKKQGQESAMASKYAKALQSFKTEFGEMLGLD
jgi:hypothetical protein